VTPIYISSSCTGKKNLTEAIETLVSHGIKDIELSGGTEHYPNFNQDLIQLKNKYSLNLLLHNYFPPPPKHFVLNLASLNPEIHQMCMEHCFRSIDLSLQLGAKKLAFHAGFLMDIKLHEIGKKLSKAPLFNRQKALEQFALSFELLKKMSGSSLELYVENNVLSAENYESYEHSNPLFFTDWQSYQELKSFCDFQPLIDWAHLYVSCNTLHLDFVEQLDLLLAETDYIHLSDNDGLRDSNQKFHPNSAISRELMKAKGKSTTLEIYEDFVSILESKEMLQNAIR